MLGVRSLGTKINPKLRGSMKDDTDFVIASKVALSPWKFKGSQMSHCYQVKGSGLWQQRSWPNLRGAPLVKAHGPSTTRDTPTAER